MNDLEQAAIILLFMAKLFKRGKLRAYTALVS